MLTDSGIYRTSIGAKKNLWLFDLQFSQAVFCFQENVPHCSLFIGVQLVAYDVWRRDDTMFGYSSLTEVVQCGMAVECTMSQAIQPSSCSNNVCTSRNMTWKWHPIPAQLVLFVWTTACTTIHIWLGGVTFCRFCCDLETNVAVLAWPLPLQTSYGRGKWLPQLQTPTSQSCNQTNAT